MTWRHALSPVRRTHRPFRTKPMQPIRSAHPEIIAGYPGVRPYAWGTALALLDHRFAFLHQGKAGFAHTFASRPDTACTPLPTCTQYRHQLSSGTLNVPCCASSFKNRDIALKHGYGNNLLSFHIWPILNFLTKTIDIGFKRTNKKLPRISPGSFLS